MPVEFPVQGTGSIRLLEWDDLPHLEWHGGPDLRSFYNETWEKHSNGECTVLVADFNEYPIGQIVIHWSGKPAHLDFPDQQSLRVHPAFRSMGLGSLLIRSSETLVASAGFPKVGLSVATVNSKARRLYERLGYVVSGTEYDDTWNYLNSSGEQVFITETVLDMVKVLSPLQLNELNSGDSSKVSGRFSVTLP